jgi:hypothetical protein
MLTLLQFILVEQLFVIAPILLWHSVEYQIKIVEWIESHLMAPVFLCDWLCAATIAADVIANFLYINLQPCWYRIINNYTTMGQLVQDGICYVLLCVFGDIK